MSHVRRMQHNRRIQIYKRIREKDEYEKRNSRKHDELSSGEGEISLSECSHLLEQSSRDR